MKTNSPRIVCFRRYIPNYHILPDCKQSITDLDTKVRNYEALDAYIKAGVLDKYYLPSKTLIKRTHEH